MNKSKGTSSSDLAAFIQRERKKIEVCGQTIADFVMEKEQRLWQILRPGLGTRFVVTDKQIGDSTKAIQFANTLLSDNDQIAESWRLAVARESDYIEQLFELPDVVDGGWAHVGFIVESESSIKRIQEHLPTVRVFRVS